MKGGCCGLYCIEIKGNESGRFTISGLVLIEIRYDRMSLAKKHNTSVCHMTSFYVFLIFCQKKMSTLIDS